MRWLQADTYLAIELGNISIKWRWIREMDKEGVS